MSRRVLSTLKRISHRSIPTSSLQHPLRPSTSFGSRSLTTFFASNHLIDVSSPDVSQTDRIIASETEDLLAVLERGNAEPSEVWSHYTDLLQSMGLFSPPLAVHQRVLRRCVPSPDQTRFATANEYHSDAPHPFEGRLRAVMENMLSAGLTPELEDYEFILRQYASCGHYLGTKEIMKEMQARSIEPRVKTYGLCLQALAHRLVLPCEQEDRPYLVDSITQMCRELMIEMQDRRIPFSSVNMDLAIRILKEAADDEGFDQLIKLGYGIDLAYPDRPPLEAQDGTLSLPSHPLSTSALNMIIDTLGRAGRISKMVQAFEVLTQPLPQVSSPSSAFDDEEDETIYPTSSSAPQYRPPHAESNTRTFNLLVMHAARARHAVIARHYIVQARHQEELESQHNKDVYMAEEDERVTVDRAKWKKIVRFGERPPEAEKTQSVADFVQARNPRPFGSSCCARPLKRPTIVAFTNTRLTYSQPM
ncbi:hypothetical protein EWM64_g3743 [Hericium alpestre]|uniref:Pentacotripeptide-repeat region of PRORP domain-containing protein n=1 Tax=Hericium alpestre TaxID=135208 RepID=A0A4Z0A1Q4_9AGAM|nr:hypothetical protein EWM64_g3743 [Hericium alpestre]